MASFAATSGNAAGATAAGVNLPAPPKTGSMSLEEALAQRRSVREFSADALTLNEISRLAWAAQGITGRDQRTAPSAGATYPLEIYLAVGNAGNLPSGLYHYLPKQHRLEVVSGGDIRAALAEAAVGQMWLGHAPVIFAIAAVPSRTAARYGKRGERYVHMEAGHAAQNLLLEATALGLGATPVGAFDDARVAGILHLKAGEDPLYLIPAGRPLDR